MTCQQNKAIKKAVLMDGLSFLLSSRMRFRIHVFQFLICQFGIWWYLPRFIRSYRIKLTDGAVIINRGVFIKTTHIMPYSRMIYTQTFITPIARLMGLEAFSLKAARSRITVPELLNEDADKILKMLAQEANNEKGL